MWYEQVFVTEEEGQQAEAEIARRSRVMAGTEGAEAAALESAIVEELRRLAPRDRCDPTPPRDVTPAWETHNEPP